MFSNRSGVEGLSDFLKYLSVSAQKNGDRIPSLTSLSKILGVSVASLREQLEVARALGFVEVRPRTGIKRNPYKFFPAVWKSLSYAVSVEDKYFRQFSDLRVNLELSYWYKAVNLLTEVDKERLKSIVANAKEKLMNPQVIIPNQEHRDFHLTIFSKIENEFVKGIMEAYWEMYDVIGMNMYTDINYLERVWDSHEDLLEAICNENYVEGHQLLKEHMGMLDERTKPLTRQIFE